MARSGAAPHPQPPVRPQPRLPHRIAQTVWLSKPSPSLAASPRAAVNTSNVYEDDAGGASDDEGDHLAAGKGKKYEKYDRESQKNYNYSMPEEFDDEEIDSDDVS